MSYSTKEEVREMLKDDALNAIIGDTFIEDPAEREELVEPLIEAAIADADAEIDGYLAKRYTVPISPAPRVLNKFSKDIAVYNLFSRIGIDESTERENWGTFRTDTMILVSIDFSNNDVCMVSIPRDSYVKIYNANGNVANPSSPYSKINNAFSEGGGAQKKGFEYSIATVEKLKS